MQVVTELKNHEAVFKLMYLALRNISKRWTMPIKNWSAAMNQFAVPVYFGGNSQNSSGSTRSGKNTTHL